MLANRFIVMIAETVCRVLVVRRSKINVSVHCRCKILVISSARVALRYVYCRHHLIDLERAQFVVKSLVPNSVSFRNL